MTPSEIIAAIDAAKDARGAQAPRAYIGASIIGKPCDAFLAYSLRGFPEDEIEPRVRRIFRLGNVLEDEVVRDMKRAGIDVFPVDPLTGRQFAWDMHGGHVKAHADGQVLFHGHPIRGLEIKSMALKPFEEFKANGVRRSHPYYFAQMTMMMGMSGIGEFMFIAYCKNNSEYHVEFVDFDVFEWGFLQSRIDAVMAGEARKIAASPDDWRCRFCGRRKVCWDQPELPRACRTCRHAAPRSDGLWQCLLDDTEAKDACNRWERYEPLPA